MKGIRALRQRAWLFICVGVTSGVLSGSGCARRSTSSGIANGNAYAAYYADNLSQRVRPTPAPSTSSGATDGASIGASTGSAGIRSAFSAIQASSFNDQRGTEICGSDVGFFDDGDWLRYDSVDFGMKGANGITFTLGEDPNYAGSFIDIRIDSVSGAILGSLQVASTGDWGTYSDQSATISNITGVHDIYLVGRGGYGIANIRSFVFTAASGNSSVGP